MKNREHNLKLKQSEVETRVIIRDVLKRGKMIKGKRCDLDVCVIISIDNLLTHLLISFYRPLFFSMCQ